MQAGDIIEAQNPVYTCLSKLRMKINVNRPRIRRDLLSEPHQGGEKEKEEEKKTLSRTPKNMFSSTNITFTLK